MLATLLHTLNLTGKHHLLSKLFISTLVYFLSGISFAMADTSLTNFSDHFKQAHAANDYDQIARLINWEGVRKPMRKRIEVYTMGTFGLPIKGIEITEVGREKFESVDLAGKKLKPNMKVTHLMRVHFEIDASDVAATDKDTAVYLLGESADVIKIAVYTSDSKHGAD